jgi:hypothetical protein
MLNTPGNLCGCPYAYCSVHPQVAGALEEALAPSVYLCRQPGMLLTPVILHACTPACCSVGTSGGAA